MFYSAVNLNVTDFGANGTDKKDDSFAFQRCVDRLAILGGGTMEISKGNYYISHVHFYGKKYSNIIINGNGSVISQFFIGNRKLIERWSSYSKINAADGCFIFDAKVSKQFNDEESIKNISINELNFISDVVNLGFDELSHQISAHGVSGFTVNDSSFTGFLGDGICINAGTDFTKNYGAYNKNIKIIKCKFDGLNNDNRQAISFYYCDGFLVKNCDFKNTTRKDMPGAIDVEPMDRWQISRNGTISNCRFENIGGIGAIVLFLMGKSDENPVKSSHGFLVENCNFDNVRTPLTVIGNGCFRKYSDENYNVVFRDSKITNFKTILDFRKAYGIFYYNLTFTNNDKLYFYKQLNEFSNFTIKSCVFEDTEIMQKLSFDKKSSENFNFQNNLISEKGKKIPFFF